MNKSGAARKTVDRRENRIDICREDMVFSHLVWIFVMYNHRRQSRTFATSFSSDDLSVLNFELGAVSDCLSCIIVSSGRYCQSVGKMVSPLLLMVSDDVE